MALSDFDKKYLDTRQQQAILTYTAQYERAVREGNQQAAQMAHEGAESIRKLAGYSGGASGDSFLEPSTAASKTVSFSTGGKTTYQTVPATNAVATVRADELDKLLTPSATRQNQQSRDGGFGTRKAGSFGGTSGTGLSMRIGQGAAAGLACSGALLTETAGTIMDVQGGTGMTPVYREQERALTKQITALKKELCDPKLTARERQDTNEALQIAQAQKNIYTRATAANEGTAEKLYETTDDGLRYAQKQAEESVRGTNGLERELLSRVPGMTQRTAITGLNLVAPWLGTTAAVLADAGAVETQYRHKSGADYDAKATGVLGAKTIAKDAASVYGQSLLRDYAETLRQLAEPDRPQLPQSAYVDALSRLEASNGAGLTKPVSAYSAPPSVIELPETLETAVVQSAYDELRPDSVLEAFLPAKNYIRGDGTFWLEAANADYSKIFLPTVPEKNRMYLQQAADAVDYLITDDPRISLGYSAKLDAIIYNPHHPMFARQDWDTAITHDLAHRIDRWFVNSSEVDAFKKAIKAVQTVSPENWEKIVEYCQEKDREGFLSDTIDALCESQYKLPFWHGKAYWTDARKAKEIFANLFSLEAVGDMEKISFLKRCFPDLMKTFDGLDFALR